MEKNIPPIHGKVEEIYFESDAGIYKHIGRGQIDSETVALIEIVKNSYDADATEVSIYFDNADKSNGEIIITDNGNGMTPQDFKQFWMKPATSHKEFEPRSLIFRRTMLGRKGMGRFGTDKVARIVVIKSKTKDDRTSFYAKIDGDKFDQPGAKFEKIPVEFNLMRSDNLKFVQKDYLSGTEIRMKNLRARWTMGMIKEIHNELSSMISPAKQSSDFNIKIEVKGNQELSGILENKMSIGYSHEVVIKIDEYDTYSISLNNKVVKTGNVIDDCEEILTSAQDETIATEIAPTKLKSFGSLTAKIFYFKDGGLVKRETIKHGRRVDHSGVKIYRSNFRVLPYGEKIDDWLRIKAKRSARGGKYYITPEKITGIISIDADHNPRLEDTTNRQSLILNDEFKTFRFFFSEIVVEGFNKILEQEQSSIKDEIRKKRYQNVSRQVADILSKLKSDIVKKVVNENNKKRSALARKLVEDSLINNNGQEGIRKTKEKVMDKTKKTRGNTLTNSERKPYTKHKRILISTDRFISRPVDAWINDTHWIVRDEYSPNEELEAWINENDQEIVYNTGHTMFLAAEISDKLVGQNLETGCGIATQIHIHKSIAVGWGLYHESKEHGTFLSRYNEYEDLASSEIQGNRKFVEEIPTEELEEVSNEESLNN